MYWCCSVLTICKTRGKDEGHPEKMDQLLWFYSKIKQLSTRLCVIDMLHSYQSYLFLVSVQTKIGQFIVIL